MSQAAWEEEPELDFEEDEQDPSSVFDDYFDDPYAELDEEYEDEEPEEHPLRSRSDRRRRRYSGDD